MKTLYGDQYLHKVQWYKNIVEKYCEKEKVDTLKAVIKLAGMCDEEAVSIMMFMAAAVEIIEGKNEKQA